MLQRYKDHVAATQRQFVDNVNTGLVTSPYIVYTDLVSSPNVVYTDLVTSPYIVYTGLEHWTVTIYSDYLDRVGT